MHPKHIVRSWRQKFKALHFVEDEDRLKKSMASLKRYCTVNGLFAVKKYLQQSWEPFAAMWVQFYRKDFWSGQANTNNISEGRIGSFKKGLKNVADGSIFSAVKFLLETYAPNDVQDFRWIGTILGRTRNWSALWEYLFYRIGLQERLLQLTKSSLGPPQQLRVNVIDTEGLAKDGILL